MAASKSKLTLPEPMGIKPLAIECTSVYLRWAILSSHSLSTEQLKKLCFEFKSSDGKLRADCIVDEAKLEYKARLCGLSEDTKYRFQIRSKLKLKSKEIMCSSWSNRVEFSTHPKMEHFMIISDEKELEMESLKHRLKHMMNENKKLSLQIEQLQQALNNKEEEERTPGHWQWDYKKIVNWIMRIQDGVFKQYKQTLLKNLKNEGISGRDLVMVNEANLKEWGITGFQHKKVLIHYIQQLTENDTKTEIVYNPDIAKHLTVDEMMEQEQEKKKEEEEEEEVIEDPEQKEESAETPKVPSIASSHLTKSVEALINEQTPTERRWRYKEGMLSVTVIGATNVDNLDSDEGPQGASDPYVELELKGNYKREKTKTQQNNANPVWNEKFQLFVDNARSDVLKVTMYDHDKWTMDDKIGRVEIPLITVIGANGMLRKNFDVIGSKCGCTLELGLKYWESTR